MLNYSYDRKKTLVAFVVPTGIGASIGGFAGDASCFAREFTCNFNVIVNPNVVNAACFSGINESMLYTEGWTLSQFFKGNINLVPSKHNKIGVIFDKGISQGVLNIHLNTINAIKTVYGIDITGYEISEEPAAVEFFNMHSGISSGSVSNPETLVSAGRKLIEKGAKALAVVCKFEEPPEDNYKNGGDVDIVGGVEAVISHYLTRELLVPVVHAPAFENIDITKELVDPRAAAEYITPTFLPCLLIALDNAPLISCENREYYISRDDVSALIMPFDALGSSVVLDAVDRNIDVYAIKENKSVLNINKDVINKNGIIKEANTYKDCLRILKERFDEKK